MSACTQRSTVVRLNANRQKKEKTKKQNRGTYMCDDNFRVFCPPRSRTTAVSTFDGRSRVTIPMVSLAARLCPGSCEVILWQTRGASIDYVRYAKIVTSGGPIRKKERKLPSTTKDPVNRKAKTNQSRGAFRKNTIRTVSGGDTGVAQSNSETGEGHTNPAMSSFYGGKKGGYHICRHN